METDRANTVYVCAVFYTAGLGCFPPGEITYRVEGASEGLAADILLVVDESRSMGGEHRWLPDMVRNLETQLRSSGIGTFSDLPNRYGLVGYGRRQPIEYARVLATRTGRTLFSAAEYSQANDQLIADDQGRIEDGYQAIDHALTELPYRKGSNIARNIILITDEDRDVITQGATLTRESMKTTLESLGFILNVVVDNTFSGYGFNALGVDSNNISYIEEPNGQFRRETRDVRIGKGYSGTRQDYTELALALNGAAWDINILREGSNGADSFTAAIVEVKTQEIRKQLTLCRRCICQLDGNLICLPMLNQQECLCRYNKGQVSRWSAMP